MFSNTVETHPWDVLAKTETGKQLSALILYVISYSAAPDLSRWAQLELSTSWLEVSEYGLRPLPRPNSDSCIRISTNPSSIAPSLHMTTIDDGLRSDLTLALDKDNLNTDETWLDVLEFLKSMDFALTEDGRLKLSEPTLDKLTHEECLVYDRAVRDGALHQIFGGDDFSLLIDGRSQYVDLVKEDGLLTVSTPMGIEFFMPAYPHPEEVLKTLIYYFVSSGRPDYRTQESIHCEAEGLVASPDQNQTTPNKVSDISSPNEIPELVTGTLAMVLASIYYGVNSVTLPGFAFLSILIGLIAVVSSKLNPHNPVRSIGQSFLLGMGMLVIITIPHIYGPILK